MIFVYKNQEFDISWIWSEVLHPLDRFIIKSRSDGVSRGCTMSDEVLRIRLHQELARETGRELLNSETEWPSQYWDSVKDYRYGRDIPPEDYITSETVPLAPIYAYLFP